MGEHNKLSDRDVKEMRVYEYDLMLIHGSAPPKHRAVEKTSDSKPWDGVERRKSINSVVDPYHERRRPKKK